MVHKAVVLDENTGQFGTAGPIYNAKSSIVIGNSDSGLDLIPFFNTNIVGPNSGFQTVRTTQVDITNNECADITFVAHARGIASLTMDEGNQLTYGIRGTNNALVEWDSSAFDANGYSTRGLAVGTYVIGGPSLITTGYGTIPPGDTASFIIEDRWRSGDFFDPADVSSSFQGRTRITIHTALNSPA